MRPGFFLSIGPAVPEMVPPSCRRTTRTCPVPPSRPFTSPVQLPVRLVAGLADSMDTVAATNHAIANSILMTNPYVDIYSSTNLTLAVEFYIGPSDGHVNQAFPYFRP